MGGQTDRRRSRIRTVGAIACALASTLATGAFINLARGTATRSSPGLRKRIIVKGSPDVVSADKDEEQEVWMEAFKLEEERAELLNVQLRAEIVRLGEASEELVEEFEGCILDLDDIPTAPESEASGEWAAAYQAIRRCNEQSELKLGEMRDKIEAKYDADRASTKPEVTMDFGPIAHKGITFSDITFPRLATGGSSIFFVELQMPLGTALEEKMVEYRGGVARTVEVTDISEGGSAGADGRIRPGDLLRCVTVVQRRLSQIEEMEGEGGGGLLDAVGVGAGEQTKALLVIPEEGGTFPFERLLEEIKSNGQIDGLVGMVFERPFN